MIKGKVAIIVLNYNGRQKIAECLSFLEKTIYDDYEVILLDNNSNDGSVEFVENNFGKVKTYRLDRNYGFVGYNRIIDKVDCEYIVLLNNDIVIVDGHWLSKLIRHLSLNNDVAAVTPKIKFANSNIINAAGGICDIFGTAMNRGNGEEDTGQYNVSEEVFFGVGACLALRKKVWQEIGGFDEQYFMYAEDVDWCWRAWLGGYRILYVNDAIVEHYWHSSSNASFMVYNSEKNGICNFIKNYRWTTIVKLLPALIGIKILKLIVMSIYFRKIDLFNSILRAHKWVITRCGEILRHRKEVRRARSDKFIQKMMNKTSLEIELALNIREHPFISRYLKK